MPTPTTLNPQQAGACAGVKTREPVQKDQPYGERSYGVADPEDHDWYFATHVRDVAPEDMQPPA